MARITKAYLVTWKRKGAKEIWTSLAKFADENGYILRRLRYKIGIKKTTFEDSVVKIEKLEVK